MGICARWGQQTTGVVGPSEFGSSDEDSGTPLALQRSGAIRPAAGIFFFDAWRIRPCLDVPANMAEELSSVEAARDEQMPERTNESDTTQIDKQLQRDEALKARQAAKSSSDLALEVSNVLRLIQAYLDSAEEIEQVTDARKRFKELKPVSDEPSSSGRGGVKRRADDTAEVDQQREEINEM